MPLYVGDYLRDTMNLSLEEHGAYFLLLLACWTGGGSVPDDDRDLAAICRVSQKRWRFLRKRVAAYFVESPDGKLVHPRVVFELDKAQQLSEIRRIVGKKGGRPRKQIETNSFPIAVAKRNQNETPSPSPSPRELTLSVISPPSPFESFWASYPRKTGKLAAEKAYAKAVKLASPELISAALAQVLWPPDKQFIPHPATWLNQGRWMDDAETDRRRVGFV